MTFLRLSSTANVQVDSTASLSAAPPVLETESAKTTMAHNKFNQDTTPPQLVALDSPENVDKPSAAINTGTEAAVANLSHLFLRMVLKLQQQMGEMEKSNGQPDASVCQLMSTASACAKGHPSRPNKVTKNAGAKTDLSLWTDQDNDASDFAVMKKKDHWWKQQ